ncbi:MAG TPA: hypothetical protein VI391_03010 [Thermoanaerobaculia bacterium]
MRYRMTAAALLALALGVRLFVAWTLPTRIEGDAAGYVQFATNLLRRHVYSSDEQPPIRPTYERVPGYPLFLAAVRINETAARVVQAIVDTMTCALAGAIAFAWTKRRRAFLIALFLAAICPFTIDYVAFLLTETWMTFLVAAMVLALSARRAEFLALAGLLGGIAAMVRLEGAAMFAAAAIFVIITERWRVWILLAAFAIVLLPWTIRNATVFHTFQPLAPVHANMPEDFVPSGYTRWVQTWVDDFQYVREFEWSLDSSEIDITHAPPGAFDSPAERQRVAALFNKYNDDGEMTPALDAQFGEIARERIARNPLRFYVVLPIERASSMWRGFRWIYLLLGLAGAIALRKTKWLLLLALMIVPRMIGASMLPNPEPRYMVEFFPLLSASAAAALAGTSADRLSGALRRFVPSRR